MSARDVRDTGRQASDTPPAQPAPRMIEEYCDAPSPSTVEGRCRLVLGHEGSHKSHVAEWATEWEPAISEEEWIQAIDISGVQRVDPEALG